MMRSGASLPGRSDERFIADDGDVIIAVRDDGALVEWLPERNDCVVLFKELPKPMVVLRTSNGGTLCVAGYTAQHLGVRLRRNPTNYCTLSYGGESIQDGEIDDAGIWVGVACRDRHLRILDADDGSVVAAVSYEKSGNRKLRGAATHCTFGRGGYAGRLIFATSDGHIGSWNWKDATIERIAEDATAGASRPAYCFAASLRASCWFQRRTTLPYCVQAAVGCPALRIGAPSPL